MKTRCGLCLLPVALLAAGIAAAIFWQPVQRATAEDVEQDGRIVEIGPDPASEVEIQGADAAVEAPAFWIGIQGVPIDSPVLRTHLQLAEDVGVVVADLLPGSPAEKAGIRKHDILIGVGDEQVNDMTVLQRAVAKSRQKPIELKLIRLAKEVTVVVTPEETPAEFAHADRTQELPGQLGGLIPGDVNQLFKDLERRGLPNVQVFGPGGLGGRPLGVGALPNGVSVNVTREGDKPAKVTVKKGDKTWTVEGDDKEAIAKLPEGVRPIVEQLLAGGGQLGGRLGVPNFNFERQLERVLPGRLSGVDARTQDFEAERRRMMERMEDLEKRMEQFQRQLQEEAPAEISEPAADPSST